MDFWGCDDIIMKSLAPRPKIGQGTGSVLFSNKLRSIISSQIFLNKKKKKKKNAERLEVATSL